MISQLQKIIKENETKHKREIEQLRQAAEDQKIMEKRNMKSRERQNTWQSTGVIQVGNMVSSSTVGMRSH